MTEAAQIVLRRAVARDAPAIAELWLRARYAKVPEIPPPRHDDEDVRRWIADVVVGSSETWVALDRERIVAMMALRVGWIDQLYVEPARTGRGIGSLLVALAQRSQPEGLDLWAFQANLGARRFYERHGFVAVAFTEGDNEEGAPDVRYHWSANAAAAG
jgi:GNAT superfamily N-acetyltransferase